MTKIFDKQIENLLKSKRDNAIFIAENNLRYARQDEKFYILEKKEVEKIIEIANLMAEEKDCKKEKCELTKIKEEKNARLKIIGFDEKDIKPQFFCSKCQDRGRYKDSYCQCRMDILNEILLQRSGMVGVLEDFKKAKFNSSNCENKQIFKILKDWTEKYPDITKKTIYLTGATGVGKTFLLKCIANELIKKGVFVFYTTAFRMNNDFLQYCKSDLTEKNNILAPYLESEVLLLDDLGTEPILNNITLNYLYLILNERILGDKSTIINSNLDMMKLLDRYGERIFSRIVNKKYGLAIKFNGEDLRLKK